MASSVFFTFNLTYLLLYVPGRIITETLGWRAIQNNVLTFGNNSISLVPLSNNAVSKSLDGTINF
jgi:hypothetical protein